MTQIGWLYNEEMNTWAPSEISSGGLPDGGTTGQVLTKQSDADGDAGWDNGGSLPFVSATVTLTSEEILALASSPKTLVAAPGADKVLVAMGISGVSRFVTTGYTVAGDIVVRQPSPSNNLNLVCYQLGLALTGYDSTDEFSFDWMPGSAAGPTGGYGDDLSAVANKSLQLKATGSDPTDGDGGLTVTVYYALIDLT